MAGWVARVTVGLAVGGGGRATPRQGYRDVSCASWNYSGSKESEETLGRLTQVKPRRRRTGYGSFQP